MKGSPALIDPGLSMFSAVRHLERIADHATNIAEDVIYLVEGEIVRHHPEAIQGEESGQELGKDCASSTPAAGRFGMGWADGIEEVCGRALPR